MKDPKGQDTGVACAVFGEKAAEARLACGPQASELELPADTVLSVTMRAAAQDADPAGEEQMEVVLLPQGRVAVCDAGEMTIAAGARWEALGYVRQGAVEMSFVRAEIRGESWSSLVQSAWLNERRPSPPVTLKQQTAPHEPPQGWSLFC
jgi:hypothetical protein